MRHFIFLFLLSCLLLNPALGICHASGFYVTGELALTIPAQRVLETVKERPNEPFTIYVYTEHATLDPAYTANIKEVGRFTTLVPLNIPDTYLVLRALHKLGLISAEDFTLTQIDLAKLKDQKGSVQLKGIVITITTLIERYNKEMKEVNKFVAKMNFDQAFALLDRIQSGYLPAGEEFLYRVLQLRLQIMHAAFKHGKDVEASAMHFIQHFSEGKYAATFSPERKYTLLLQYIRALRSSPYKLTKLTATGDTIGDIIGKAFEECIAAFIQTDRDPKMAIPLANEYFDYLNDTGKHYELVENAGKYFDFANLPERHLKAYQRKMVVRTLIAMGHAIAKETELISYAPDEYITTIKVSDDAKRAWKTYMKYLTRWQYFFPEGSSNMNSRCVHRYYVIGQNVLRMMEEEGYE